jgi:ribosomal protein L37AE/L43A
MAKKEKLKTPNWVLEGYDSEEAYDKAKGKSVKKKGKTFKLKRCPECGSDNVSVVVEREAKGMWECRKCKWKGTNIKEDELSEEEFMKYLDDSKKFKIFGATEFGAVPTHDISKQNSVGKGEEVS